MKKILLLVGTLLLALGLNAQEAPSVSHYFGLSAGMTSGYGLTYRYWPGTWGLQVNTSPVVSDQTAQINFGATGLYLVQDLRWTRFFLYAGGNGTYASRSFWVARPWTGAVGLGAGFEFIAFDHVAFDLQAGYQASSNYSLSFNPSVEVGLYYRL